MKHSPIIFSHISLSYPHKTCFANFNAQIQYGQRIAIIGRNGSGKSTLLKMIVRLVEPTTGHINSSDDVVFGYVPQVVESFDTASGGERFQHALTQALKIDPNLLCLDEPTNHLDMHHRKRLMQLLNRFSGTLVVISHDSELLRTLQFDQIWNIEDGTIHQFSGSYDHYLLEHATAKQQAIQNIEHLKKEQQKVRHALQAEQKREARSKKAHRDETDRVRLGAMRERGSKTAGKNVGKTHQARQQVSEALAALRLPEEIKPKFKLDHVQSGSSRPIVAISDGACGYDAQPITYNIQLQIGATERIAILGNNGSGKSTLLKAIMSYPAITRTGDWYVPHLDAIGYLDQHYQSLDENKSVFETIADVAPKWHNQEIRKHLNDFLFRKNEEVDAKINTLSGGEKVRLALAQIAAQSPRLLLLDEVTNNVDQETREHIIQVLNAYPSAIVVVSHDEDFLARIGITSFYRVIDGLLIQE